MIGLTVEFPYMNIMDFDHMHTCPICPLILPLFSHWSLLLSSLSLFTKGKSRFCI